MQARERLAPSERLLQAFLAIGPVAHSKSQYHFLLGLHYLRMRRPGEAEASLRRALELWRASPLSPVTSLHKHLLKLRLTLSQSLWEMAPGDCVSGAALREAQSLIIQATQSDSKRADIWNSLGRLLFESNRVQLARGVYDLITESFPENMDLWNNLGLVHLLGLHDDEAAVRCLHRVLLNNKDHFEALNNYAVILLKEGLLRESSAVLEYALSINERQPQAWNHLALVYLRMGQDAKARVALSKARAFSEGDPEAGASVRFNLANHLMKVARKEGDAARQRQQLDAAAQLLEALPDKETSCEVQTAFGRLRAMQAEFASDDAAARSLRSEAQAAYERALAIHPASIAALNGLALLHTDSLAYDRAEQLLRSVLQRGITSANCAVMCNLGISLQLSHRLADAEFVYRSGIEMHPRSPQLRNNLGNLLRQSGRLAEAEAEYEAALKIDPKFAMALSNLALVKVVRDDLTAALDLLERALAEDPELLCARSNLLKVRALLARRAAPAAASLSSA
jgi:tetratricopeptide (TPR) repeat protein